MIGVDTNVLVRYIAQDDPAQSKRATRLIEHECSAATPGYVSLVALVEQQPALLADPAVHAPLKALRELPPRLAFARQVFNEAGSAYNEGTQQFPTRLLRSVLGFVQAGLL